MRTSSLLWVAIGCFIVGMGMGLVASPTLIAAQASAEWSERGVVTATNMFARSIGSAVGVAVFGAVVNTRLGGVDHPAAGQLAPAVHLVFVGVAAMAVVLIGASAVMPRRSEGNPENASA